MSPHLNGHDRLEGPLAPRATGIAAAAFALSQTPRSLLRPHSLGGQAVVLAFCPMDWERVSRVQLTLYQAFIMSIPA